MFKDLFSFYRSREWEKFRQMVIAERMHDDGFIYDEVTEQPIVKAYDIILHHIIPLTEENVNDYDISLNPQNIQIVSHKTHNYLHDKFGHSRREVFLVYGAPLSGKSTYVKNSMSAGDLVVDIDSVWQCISDLPRYEKPKRLNAVAFKIRDSLLDCVKYRVGKWNNAYVIGGYPLQGERERLIKELGAREVYIEATEAECIERLKAAGDGRDQSEWEGYIHDWFERYDEPLKLSDNNTP